MSYYPGRISLVIPLGFAILPMLQAQSADQDLTAREIFYASVDSRGPANKAKPPAVGARRPPARKRPGDVSPDNSVGQSGVIAADPPVTRPASGIQTINTANLGQNPLGLRYSILQITPSGSQEVDRDTEFHAKDAIRLSVESSSDAFLYIVNKGSSGTWKILFPSPEVQGGDNRIRKGQEYEVPTGYRFTFDEQPGVEKVFIVLSRQPEPNLDKLVYSLPSSQGTRQHDSAEPPDTRTTQMIASAAVDDSMIAHFRNVYSRDLIVEKVDPTIQDHAPAARKREKAVYTVNSAGGEDARVVADISLKHK